MKYIFNRHHLSGTIIQIPVYRTFIQSLYTDIFIQVPLYRCLYTDTFMQIPLYRYHHTDTIIQIPLYRYHIQIPLFRYLYKIPRPSENWVIQALAMISKKVFVFVLVSLYQLKMLSC